MNEKEARRLLAERSQGICEVCGRARATNAHHRKNRSAGGKWTPENLLHLCGSGTTGCHGLITVNPALSREQGWSVPSWGDPSTTPAWLAFRGYSLLTPVGTIEIEAA